MRFHDGYPTGHMMKYFAELDRRNECPVAQNPRTGQDVMEAIHRQPFRLEEVGDEDTRVQYKRLQLLNQPLQFGFRSGRVLASFHEEFPARVRVVS